MINSKEEQKQFVQDEKGIRAYNEFLQVGISIYEGGEFKDNDGKTVKFGAGQKVLVGGSNGRQVSIRLSPGQLLFIKSLLDEKEIVEVLQERLVEEQSKVAETFSRLIK